MKTRTKIQCIVLVVVMALLTFLVALWVWAIFGVSEQIMTASIISSVVLFTMAGSLGMSL